MTLKNKNKPILFYKYLVVIKNQIFHKIEDSESLCGVLGPLEAQRMCLARFTAILTKYNLTMDNSMNSNSMPYKFDKKYNLTKCTIWRNKFYEKYNLTKYLKFYRNVSSNFTFRYKYLLNFTFRQIHLTKLSFCQIYLAKNIFRKIVLFV